MLAFTYLTFTALIAWQTWLHRLYANCCMSHCKKYGLGVHNVMDAHFIDVSHVNEGSILVH